MNEVISAEILEGCWSHELFIGYFRDLFGDAEVPLTREVLMRMRFDGKISIDMWFEAQFPQLNPQYIRRTKPIRDLFTKAYRTWQEEHPRFKKGHSGYMKQYREARAFLKPKEDARDIGCIDAIVEILELT